YVAWNQAGTRVVTASSDGTARVWNVSTALNTGGKGAQLAILAGHEGDVVYAAWSPDDTRIVTAGLDGRVWVWDARSGAPIAPLRGHTAP
ncbi:MAG: hypothetical protein GTO03_12860, partial [Planctomycetales bacterium]|nr:hypothetical protein [Planctomycetales bacterium]